MRLSRDISWGISLAPTTPHTKAGLVVALGLVAAAGGGILGAAVHPVAGFALLLGLGSTLAILRRVQWGLVAVIGLVYLLPFGVIPVPIGGVRLTFLDATLSIVLAIWLARLMTGRDHHFMATRLDGLLALFIGLAIASFIIGINSVTAESARFFLKTINSILFYFSVTNILRDVPRLEQAARAIIVVSLAAAGLGLGFYLISGELTISLLSSLRPLGYPSGPDVLRYIAGTKTLRAIGTAVDPNVLGGMLLLALPMVTAQLLGPRKLLSRRWLLAGVLAVGLCLLLTFSRGAWIGAAAALLFLATVRYRRLWLGLALVGLMLLALPQGELFVGRLESGLYLSDQATQMRLGEYKDALRLIERYPWFGVGFGAAPDVDIYVAVSSVYLLIAEEMGVVGLGAFMLLMGGFLVYTLGAWRGNPDHPLASIQLGAVASVVGALIAGLFDHYFFNLQFPHTVALFWLFVGVAVVASRLMKEPATTP